MENKCEKCKGTGFVKEEGSCHTCWDCLKSGKFEIQRKMSQ